MANTKTFNFTPLFVVWSIFFVVLAFVQDNMGPLWWAAAPWLFALTFGFVVALFAASVIYTKYRQGEPIMLTTRKGVRVVRRGAEPVWKVRR